MSNAEYLQIGGQVVYRLDDIERYEAGRIKNSPVAGTAARRGKSAEGTR